MTALRAVGWFVAGSAAGILIGRSSHLEWDSQVGVVDAAGLLVTVALAILAGALLPEVLKSTRSRRTHAAGIASRALSELEAIRNLVARIYHAQELPSSRRKEILEKFTELNNLLALLERAAGVCKANDVRAETDLLKTDALQLKRLVTGEISKKYRRSDFARCDEQCLKTRVRLNDIILMLG